MQCMYGIGVATRLRDGARDPPASVTDPDLPVQKVRIQCCNAKATHVERGGWLLSCPAHRDPRLLWEELRCERVVSDSEPHQCCGKYAQCRTGDGHLSCAECRANRISDGEAKAESFTPLEPVVEFEDYGE